MRWRGFYIIFFIAFSNAYSSSFSDTLLLESGKFDIDVDHALLKVDEQLKITNSDDYQFSIKKLPFNTKSDAILRKLITYNGESAVEIIIEPEGFHYVDVYLKNIVKKTQR